jgi:hypothetical protein
METGRGADVVDRPPISSRRPRTIIRSRTRVAMALDDGARGFGGDAEALGNLGVGKLLDRHDRPGGDLGVPAW